MGEQPSRTPSDDDATHDDSALREEAHRLTEENHHLRDQVALLARENASLRERLNDPRWVSAWAIRLGRRSRGLAVAFSVGAAAALTIAAATPFDDQVWSGLRRDIAPITVVRPGPPARRAPGRPKPISPEPEPLATGTTVANSPAPARSTDQATARTTPVPLLTLPPPPVPTPIPLPVPTLPLPTPSRP